MLEACAESLVKKDGTCIADRTEKLTDPLVGQLYFKVIVPMHDRSVAATPPVKRNMMFNLDPPGLSVVKNLENNDYLWLASSPGRDSMDLKPMCLREACTRNEVWSIEDSPGACAGTNCIVMVMSNTWFYYFIEYDMFEYIAPGDAHHENLKSLD